MLSGFWLSGAASFATVLPAQTSAAPAAGRTEQAARRALKRTRLATAASKLAKWDPFYHGQLCDKKAQQSGEFIPRRASVRVTSGQRGCILVQEVDKPALEWRRGRGLFYARCAHPRDLVQLSNSVRIGLGFL